MTETRHLSFVNCTERHCLCLSVSLSILMAIFSGEPGLAGFNGPKDGGTGGDNRSYKVVQSSSQVVASNKPIPDFLQAGCHSCRPTNSVKALKETVLKVS